MSILASVDVTHERKVFRAGDGSWMFGSYAEEPYRSRTQGIVDLAFTAIDDAQTLVHRGDWSIGPLPVRTDTLENWLSDMVYNLEYQFESFILEQLLRSRRLTGAQIKQLAQDSEVAKAFRAVWGSGDIVTFYLDRALADAWNGLAGSHAV